jgi:hypothetical protein
MPKKIKFVQCDCEKGNLEEMVSTKISWCPGCGEEGDQTIFYSCDFCDKIFKRTRNILGNDPDFFSDYIEYNGKLTKEELISFAPEYFGNIYSWNEKEILNQRYD